jgi:hypothetical protein
VRSIDTPMADRTVLTQEHQARNMRAAAHAYSYPLTYASRPSREIYQHALEFARAVRRDLSDLRPRDMIDIQSFLWVLGSAEYPD